MDYEMQLDFLRRLLKNLNVASCVVTEPGMHIPPQIDLNLRANLFGIQNYSGFLQNSMSQAVDKTLYRFYDEYDCNYIFLRLPKGDSYFFIGPYLLNLPSEQWVCRRAAALGLSPEQTEHMKMYYTSLPLLDDENLLLAMANTFASTLWGSPEEYGMEYLDYAIPDRFEPIPYAFTPGQADSNGFDLSALERQIENENLLMEAVSRGMLHQVTAVAAAVFGSGTEQQMNDSLRDRKNNLVILKTLLRKAAEQGGVHPIHLHRLSAHYAGRIENARTIRQTITLRESMIRDYCQLVKRHSLSRYSPYVGKTITLVQYDLAADLRLKTIAGKLNVNSSYLSALFRRECGCTLTEYVNRERIDRSLYLLRRTEKTIQEIAAECGIQDVNYFIKLFKKQMGFTPGKYRTRMGMQRT